MNTHELSLCIGNIFLGRLERGDIDKIEALLNKERPEETEATRKFNNDILRHKDNTITRLRQDLGKAEDENAKLKAEREEIINKIKDRLRLMGGVMGDTGVRTPSSGIESEFRRGQISVFEWLLRELKKVD
jgi:hypothetical protein